MDFSDQSEYDAPQFVDFEMNLPEADDSWFDGNHGGQPLSVYRHTTHTTNTNKRREVSESTEDRLLRQIQKQREDAELQLKRSEVRKLKAFMAPSYTPIRSEKELTRPIEPVLATELRSRQRVGNNISSKVNPKNPIVQKEKSDPPSESSHNIKKLHPSNSLPQMTHHKKPVHEAGATGLSWKWEQSTLSQPKPFHLRTDERVRRKINSKPKKNNIIDPTCEVKINTQSETILEQSKEERENDSSYIPVVGAKKGNNTKIDIEVQKSKKHNVPCQPKAPLKDTINSTLEVLDQDSENPSKKRKQTNNLDEITSTKRQCSSQTQSTNTEASVTPPEPMALPLM